MCLVTLQIDCNAIVSLNYYNAFVPKCGRLNAEVQVVTSKGFVTGLALAEEPTFHNVFSTTGLPRCDH